MQTHVMLSLICALLSLTQGRILLQAPPQYDYQDGKPWSGFTADGLNFNLTAMNSTASFTAHGQSVNTAGDECLLAGAYYPDPSAFIPGPLTVPVPGGQTAVVNLVSLPRNRYQLYNATEETLGITSIATVSSNDATPTSITYKPTTSLNPQSVTVLLGVFSGSDATGRCLVKITFTTRNLAPGLAAIPPLVATNG